MTRPLSERFRLVLRHYSDLGFTSFGGPGVHIIILRQRFVERLAWVDERTFIDLFALGNALPGPGSTQLAFSIATVTQGVLPGLVAFALWSLPGALGMGGLGAGVARIPDALPGIVPALLSGLNAAAIGLILVAAMQLATASGTDIITVTLIWLSASFGICYHAPWMYPVLIAAGGITTLCWDFRRVWMFGPIRRVRDRRMEQSNPGTELETSAEPQPRPSSLRRHVSDSGDAERMVEPPSPPTNQLQVIPVKVALGLLLSFILFLTIPLSTRSGLVNAGKGVPRAFDYFCNMIIAGTIIFGGGPVVIPLLRDYVVAEGWVSSRDFLLVFAVLQAFPGPNFNFAVALGVLANPSLPIAGAILGYIGIFAPGILLKLALLPLYSSWRDKSLARSILRGLNATAAGLVFTAVWQLFLVGYLYQSADSASQEQTLSGPLTNDPFWAVIAGGSLVASRTWRAPPWLAIVGGGVAGLAWYGIQQR